MLNADGISALQREFNLAAIGGLMAAKDRPVSCDPGASVVAMDGNGTAAASLHFSDRALSFLIKDSTTVSG